MKCPDCGNINVKTEEHRNDGVVYYCSECNDKFVYDNGKN